MCMCVCARPPAKTAFSRVVYIYTHTVLHTHTRTLGKGRRCFSRKTVSGRRTALLLFRSGGPAERQGFVNLVVATVTRRVR